MYMIKKNSKYKTLKEAQTKSTLISVFFLTVAILYLSLILATFNVNDPSIFYYSSETLSIHNKGGYIGSQLAAFLLFLFGSGIIVLPLMLAYMLYLIVRKKSLKSEWDRALGAALFFVSFAGMSAYYKIDPLFAIVPGGYIGSRLYELVHSFAGSILSISFFTMLFVVSVFLMSRLSLINVIQVIFAHIRFYSTREYLYYYAINIYTLLCCICRPIKNLFITTKKMLMGVDVLESGQTIVEFETIVLDEFHKNHDEFWSTHSNTLSIQDTADFPVPSNTSSRNDKGAVVIKQTIKKQTYVLPTGDILPNFQKSNAVDMQRKSEQEQFAATLQEKLTRFGIQGKVSSIKSGPVITLIEYEPNIDSKISKIVALEDDLALALEAMSIRIIAPIPGRSVVGFEIANKKREPVTLAEILHSSVFKKFSGTIPLALGKDTVGNTVVVDLVTMPHLLVAGSTGSGKSVALNTMLISMLYCCKPENLKLILIDPKRLEFASYADIPHLVFPIITDPQRAVLALKWVVKTMEERYEQMAECGVRNIFEYQQKSDENPELESMPILVVMIDELSDLMMTAGKEVEGYIARIAQMARAAGIHMIVATQRPSVDVITGLIKVNFPSRISFRVTSKADSRTILDASGADKLLGKGDMLYMDSGSGLRRIHGGYVSNKEVDQVVRYVRSQQQVSYLDLQQEVPLGDASSSNADDGLYSEVIDFVKTIDEVSISLLQRRFRIGYNRSARIIEQLEMQGVIMPAEGSKARKVIR